MNNKSTCTIIRDLFPLYKDNKVSEETKTIIKEHIETCSECKDFYDKLEKIKRNELIDYKKIAKKIKHRRLGVAGGIIALVVIIIIVSRSIFQLTVISGNSMAPTIMDSEHYIVNKWSYKFNNPKREDIITYKTDKSIYIGRILGLPGEKVRIKNGYLYIDGQKKESSIDFKEDYFIEEKTLKENEFFVLRDNYSKANKDNIYVINKDIVGKVIVKEK